MRKIFFILPLVLCASCLSEEKIDPAKASTFVRYINGGAGDVAVAATEASDRSITILANSEARESELAPLTYKIKLIKTDEFGNIIWTKFFPGFDEAETKSYRGNAILQLADGSHVIVGENIKTDDAKDLLLLAVGANGEFINLVTFPPEASTPEQSISGYGITTNDQGNYVVLAQNNSVAGSMILHEIDKSSFAVNWSYQYQRGQGTLAKKIFSYNKEILWGGTFNNDLNNSFDIRLLKTKQNSHNAEWDLTFGDPAFNEKAEDFCQGKNGFAVIGTTNSSIDDDILFKLVSPDGAELISRGYEMDGQAETAHAINPTQDGGFVLLGSIESTVENKLRGEKDYLIIRTDALGNMLWNKMYGSKFDDSGAYILELSNGSILVLGTTNMGGLKTIMMMRTDKDGRIE